MLIALRATFPCPVTVTIEADTLEQCPVFYGRVIRGVKNGPSPQWLQDSLRAIGLRPISLLVDVTNFFTYDRNRPLHVFDADKISGNALRVHRAKGGETLMGLDDKEYTFDEGMTLISDAENVESIAGVMGGLDTGCTEDTTNVFMEAAYFDPFGRPTRAVRSRLIRTRATALNAGSTRSGRPTALNMPRV